MGLCVITIMRTIWCQEEINYLIKNYEFHKTPKLLSVLKGKTRDQIRWKARDLGLRKKVSSTKTDCSFLENFDNPETLYWWGFLTADGCITSKQIVFSLEESDKDYVIKFANRCNSNVKYVTRINSWHKKPYTMARTVVNDKFIISRLIDKLKIVPQKTYNPFDVSPFLTKERLIYFIAGLIDGDGHIYCKPKDCCIKIKVHFNWHNAFNLLADRLNEFYGFHFMSRISSHGWATLSLYRKDDMKTMLNLLRGKVPIMDRKWDKIISFI